MATGYTLPAVAPTPKFLLRLPSDVRADLEQRAEAEHRTLTNLIVHALREWLAMKKSADENA
jgi:predicted transcriptional regulator